MAELRWRNKVQLQLALYTSVHRQGVSVLHLVCVSRIVHRPTLQ